ncbi:ABC transporter ATP-binding protein/permease [Streptomyces sp. NBC_01260]|uniref:ABC transporter ATP-binding protein n=1 Tax=unclassified Streptomyces TaxID=2593676 RepID=UPI000F481EF8|nr:MULTISPECIES: ABC transporter ATP-binding protein [unclassified Streptomyces]MCX4773984.1 ABC transporter ATP-binding protein/permease [Streptomyces sp. NBC_01285]ROQ73532.1 ATP-binding cassette subfamily B protein [Streptomyces sp. CEV 2-1]RPK33387.1 putative multidrug export ATP-binding/permease protein [Streptomyces sp. ADI92-24]
MSLRSSPRRPAPPEEPTQHSATDIPIRTDPVSIALAFRRFWPLTRGDRRWILLICLFAIMAAIAETITILLFAELTDTALRNGSVSAFWKPAGQWLTVAVIGAVVGYLGSSLAAWTAERFVLRLRARVFSHLQTLPPHFFQRNRRGDLVERLTGDVDAIEQLVVTGIVAVVSAVFSALFYAAAALWLRWELALATFLLVPLFYAATRSFTGRLREVSRRGRAADGAITAVVEETLVNVLLTQAYNRQHDEEERLLDKAAKRLKAAVTAARLTGLYAQVVEVLETFCILTIIGLGAWEISAGRMTLGELLAFAAFVGYLYPPVRSLGQFGLTATAATAGAERLLEILDARPAVTDPTGSVTAPTRSRASGVVEAHQVRFHYPNNTEPVLHELSFSASPGELLVITGPSGAGKSTLAALLLRFYDPDSGSIRLDGVSVDKLPLTYLRQNITLLPQDTLVLHDTIEVNIGCGRDGATHQDVVEAARAADADAFIRALPDGYDTVISPGTSRLSGGQLQRVAIARAMLRDAPVLLLDEPTTGLDTLAAERILTPLRRLAEGRTTIVITHDLSLAANADRILVLDRGRLVQSGTHTQLLSQRGLYATLLDGRPRPHNGPTYTAAQPPGTHWQ